MTDPSLDLSMERRMLAPPDAIWLCWTEADLLKRWFTPHPVVTSEAEIDPRPGGIFRTVMQIPEMGEMRGPPACVLVADPARRLVWTSALGPGFRPNPPSGPGEWAFTAEILIAPDGAGSLYTAIAHHVTEADRAAHEAMGFHDGWGAAAAQLDTLALEVARGLG